MENYFKFTLMSMLFLLTNVVYSATNSVNVTIPNTNFPRTFLGPTFKIGTTIPFNHSLAYSLGAELADRQMRIGGTLGWLLSENQRIKMSAEYLRQRITYAFLSGNTDEWMKQGAIGLAYQYDFNSYEYKPQFNFDGYVSYAPSRDLGIVTGQYYNSQGQLLSFTDIRRVAGSHGAGIAPGFSIVPWSNGRVSVALNYDRVRYDTQYAINENAIGLGGTLGLHQIINDRLTVDLIASMRQPFNYYSALFSWNDASYLGNWNVGLFGGYTVGKNTLPNTYDIGLRLDYLFDKRDQSATQPLVPATYKDAVNVVLPQVQTNSTLTTWTARPAVYMPQVLAIVDRGVASSCTDGPVVISSIPDYQTEGGPVFNVATAYAFSGNNLTYSMNVVIPQGDSSVFRIDPSTGKLSFTTYNPYTYAVTITASNACGSASTKVNIINNDI